MSTLKVLKDYLLSKDDDIGYLLNDDNNGKTVMLSGAWGSGKTHFWQNDIEEDLTKELNDKDKACVYVSLYGKDNIEAIKNEILFKAYESIKDENKLAKRAISAFGFGSRLLSVSVGGVRANTGVVGDVVESFFESKKIDEAESFLADGGLICLDDFERKSKHIDLNDLFGFIAQLAIDMNCKVVIILNSDVFEGKEKEIFSQVKEKTVSKYLFFNPSVEELFDIIFKEYEPLKVYEEKIKSTFIEAGIVNARIYNQVLDNIQEWIIPNKSLIGDGDIWRYFILVNINFILTHHIVKTELIEIFKNGKEFIYNEMTGQSSSNTEYVDRINGYIVDNGLEYEKVDEYIREESNQYSQNFIENLIQKIKDKEKSNTAKSGKYDNSEGLIEFINNNQSLVKSLHFMYVFGINNYGTSHNKAEVEILNKINIFIETGII